MLLNFGVGRLLRVPWTARRSNQSVLKETSPECSLEGLMLRLKLQYFGHLMQTVDSLEKTLMLGGAGGEGDDTGWDGWMASPTQWTWIWVDSGSWWWTGRPGVLQSMGSQRVGHDWVTELNWMPFLPCLATSRFLRAWRPGTKLKDNMRKYENWCSRYNLRWIFGFMTSVNGWMVLLLFSRETPKE